MYRAIILITLIIAVECHRHCWRHSSPCHRRHHEYRIRSRERTFDHLARDVISIDENLKQLCSEYNNNRSVELFKSDVYTIQVSLDDFPEEGIFLKTKYRVLYIYAEKTDESMTNYFELRILPDIVNIRQATWTFNNGVLEIDIPYKATNNDNYVRNCDDEIDDTEFQVPKDNSVDFDLRILSNEGNVAVTTDSTAQLTEPSKTIRNQQPSKNSVSTKIY
ncbi:uncharacterized protein LOC131850145 [Achroia grisella]|uniref:uncharacterized protein LOC131850145 n=1 Tax=Achroia grisella TaxID=688607 RepID=UPI0027D298FB|nr:uncharacterized protein LOC131850145 [Achroia grisella]